MLLPLALLGQTYRVSVNYDHSQGSVVGEGSNFTYGQHVTLLAIPATGYHMFTWENGETSDVRTITVYSDTTLHLFFEPDMCQLTVQSPDTNQGTTFGTGNYRFGTQVTIMARPKTGYAFVQWTDGNTQNPRTIAVNASNTVYTAVFGVATYNITATSSSAAMGLVQGGGTYPYNSTATLTALPNQGYMFSSWTDGNTSNPRTVQVTGDAYYVANFARQTYSVTVMSDDTNKGNAFGGGSFSNGSYAAIYATAKYGYHFGRWHDGNTQNPRTVTVSGNATYMAIFDTTAFNITVATTNSNFGLVTGSGSYKYGTRATVSAVPNAGFQFTQWLDGSTQNPRTITVLSDSIFIASFISTPCNLTAVPDDTAHGSVRGSGTYTSGTVVSLVATAAPHYHFLRWNDGNRSNPRQYTITGNVTLTAYFVLDTHNIIVATVDTVKGRVVGGGQFAYGSNVMFVAYPKSGYSFSRWSDGSTQAVRNEMVTGNMTYTAYFSTNTYSVRAVSADTNMGSVSGSGTYLHNNTVNIIAMPAQHHHFLRWNDGVTDNPRSFVVTSDTTFTAIFGYDQFTITVLSSDTTLGSVSGTGVYNYGDSITIRATPRGYGRRFVSWNDGNTEATRRVAVLANRTYLALFVENDYSVIVRSADPNKGTVSGGGQNVTYGSRVLIAAHPYPGYDFTQWDDGNTDNPRTILINGNYGGAHELVFVASFEVKRVTVTVEYDTLKGTITGMGEYRYGDTVRLAATAKSGYYFKKWSDGVTENPRVWVITSNISLTATFEAGEEPDDESIDNAEAVETTVFGANGYVIVETTTPQPVVIYDAVGRMILRDANASEGRRQYLMPATGVYIVRVGETPAHKVVVRR